MQTVRELLRPARKIHAAYEKCRQRPAIEQSATWTRLERWMNETRQLKQGLQKAQAHGWRLAATEMQRRLAAALTACGDAARAMHADCLEPIKPIPSLDTLLTELDQLYATPRARTWRCPTGKAYPAGTAVPRQHRIIAPFAKAAIMTFATTAYLRASTAIDRAARLALVCARTAIAIVACFA
jgi:hypothetical protein